MLPRRLSQKHAVSMMIQKGASFGFFSGEENQFQNDFFFFTNFYIKNKLVNLDQ